MTRETLRRVFFASWSESAQAALLLGVLLAIFFWTPLSRWSSVHYSSADLTQDFSLTKVEPGHVGGNNALSDPVTEMQPWLMFNREELAAGRFPLWDTWNGTGVPHFANYQSAVVSPFSFPFYFLSFKAALVASAFLKLFALGFFTYLFLKKLAVGHWPALVGGAAFMFAGHNIVLLSYPHVGALAALPGACYFAECALQRFELGAHGRPTLAAALAGFVLMLLTGLLAGNPEPFYFAFLLVAAWILARLVGLARRARAERRPVRPILKLAAAFIAAGAVAGGMGAFQLLPFFEYLDHSRVLEQRSFVQTPLVPHFWPLAMFPDLLGNPAGRYNLSYNIPPPNYELVNTAYIGGLVLFGASMSLIFWRRNRHVRFFAVAAVVWAIYAYDFFGIAPWIEKLPTLDRAPMNRSQGIWLFALACLLALGLDEFVKRGPRRAWNAALATLLAAAGFAVGALIGADRLIAEFAKVPSSNHELFLDFVPAHVAWILKIFAIGALGLALLWIVNGPSLRKLLCAGFIPLVFLPTGWLLHDYNPVTEDRFFFPRTEAIERVKARVGDDRVAILGEDSLPPMSNLAYRLNILPNYDALWVRDEDTLHRVVFGDSGNWRPLLKGTERGLKMFAAKWVLAKWNWLPFDSGMQNVSRGAEVRLVRSEILPSHDATQTFKSYGSNLQAVAVYLSVYPNAKNHLLHFRLEEEASGRMVSEQDVSMDEIRGTIYTQHHTLFASDIQDAPPGRMTVFRFPPDVDSNGKRYRFALSLAEGGPGDSVFAWHATKLGYGEGESKLGAEKLAGEFLFDFSFNQDMFEKVEQIGDYGLYRYRQAIPEFFVAGGAVISDSDSETIGLLRAPTFDPRRLVVISADEHARDVTFNRLGPRDNSKSKLIKPADSVRVYVVLNDGKSVVWIQDEATFLANKFKWEEVKTIPPEEFAKYTIAPDDPDLQRKLGLRTVAPPIGAKAVPTMLESSPTHHRMQVVRDQPAYLVISQAFYPGWVARVNGVGTPVLRANYGFSSIQLPKGELEIEFSYEPASLRNGLLISGASLIAGLLALGFAVRSRRAAAVAIGA